MLFSLLFAPQNFCRSNTTNASPGAQQHLSSQPQGKDIRLVGITACCSSGQDKIPQRTALSPPGSQLVRTQPLQCIPARPPTQQKQKSQGKPRLTPLPCRQSKTRCPHSRSSVTFQGDQLPKKEEFDVVSTHLHHLLSTAKWLAQKVSCFARAGEFSCL